MAKAKKIVPKEQPESMLDQKTYEDFNKEKPDPSDPNFKNAVTVLDRTPKNNGVVSKIKNAIARVFSCPNHADVVSASPGNCSKCGMRLVEKK